MDPVTMALVAQFAVGAVQGYGSKKRQKRELGQQMAMGTQFLEAGGALQRQELATLMQQEVAASSEQSLYNTEQLQEVMGTQRVLFAGRGQDATRGSAKALTENSIRNYHRDENARKLNLTFRQASTQTAQALSRLNQTASIYGLQSDTRKQMGAVSDGFKKQMLDGAGGIFNAGMGNMEAGKTFWGHTPNYAPVVQSKGVNVGGKRK